MSAKPAAIVDQALPDALNFEQLKQQGLDSIKRLAGQQWSNYNDSDPGITILDQLCYALTEFGYCAQFPIADVLTDLEGNIDYDSQFFRASEILTSAALTPDDYRKLILDKYTQVRAIYIDVHRQADNTATGAYEVGLDFFALSSSTNSDSDSDSDSESLNLQSQIHSTLMNTRGVGEIFFKPYMLALQHITLEGSISLSSQADAKQVYSEIIQTLNDYVSPLPKRSGYPELRKEGMTADEIFNGPKLNNGWITSGTSSDLSPKRECVSVLQLSTLIGAIDGVDAVEALSMVTEPSAQNSDPSQKENTREQLKVAPDSIAVISLSKDFIFKQNAATLDTSSTEQSSSADQQCSLNLCQLRANHQASTPEASIELVPPLPQGRYRDIESYYSLQNTFPSNYAIGANALNDDASDYRRAQARQLKGYLMMFDQQIANEFSQLANLGDLFSFNPKGVQLQGDLQPNIRHQRFTNSYYYQPLYQVPEVKPLLRGNQRYNYQFDGELSAKTVDQNSWEKYQQDPFNQYILGLRQSIENDTEAEQRRDRLLNHLMARQGDDANLYNDMITNCHWYGSELRSKIIVKSIWLQNTQALSYYRGKAYRCDQSRILVTPGQFHISKENLAVLNQRQPSAQLQASLADMIDQGHASPKSLQRSLYQRLRRFKLSGLQLKKLFKKIPASDGNQQLRKLLQYEAPYPTRDGQLDQQVVYQRGKIGAAQLIQYSNFELTLNLLLGLDKHYEQIAAKLSTIIVHTGFTAWLSDPSQTQFPQTGSDTLVNGDLSIKRSSGIDQLYQEQQCLLDIHWNGASPPSVSDYQNYIDQLRWLSTQRLGVLLIEHILLIPNQAAVDDKCVDELLQASLVLPAYVTLLQQAKIQGFVNDLIRLHWPAHIGLNTFYFDYSDLANFVEKFIIWHNGLSQGEGLAASPSTSLAKSPSVIAKKTTQVKHDRWVSAALALEQQLLITTTSNVNDEGAP